MPDVVEKLLKRHVPDAGGKCRGCTTPGRGTAHYPWPCALQKMAEQARDMRSGCIAPGQ